MCDQFDCLHRLFAIRHLKKVGKEEEEEEVVNKSVATSDKCKAAVHDMGQYGICARLNCTTESM